MTKNRQDQIEKDKQKIIRLLQSNSNESIDKIAKKCGFSRQKVWRIIKNLEKDNIIWGYVAAIDEEKQNKKRFTILIKRSANPVGNEVINKIVSRDLDNLAEKMGVSLENSAYVHGNYDWTIDLVAQDIKQIVQFSEILNKTYQGIIEDIEILETIFTAKKSGISNPEINKLKNFFDI